MSKYTLNFENIPKSILTKKNSNLFTPSLPIKPQFEWLQQYLQPSSSLTLSRDHNYQNYKGNELNKNKKLTTKITTTRKLLRTRQRLLIVNQNMNKNIGNNPQFGIVSSNRIGKIDQNDYVEDKDWKDDKDYSLDKIQFQSQRRKSCQIMKPYKKQYPNLLANTHKIVNIESENIQPWDAYTENDQQIVDYMLDNLTTCQY